MVNVVSGTPWRHIWHTTGFDTQQLHPQKFYECCHVCHVPKGKLPSLQKTSNWISPKKGANRGSPSDGKPTKRNPYQLPCTNFFDGYWYGLILFWWLLMVIDTVIDWFLMVICFNWLRFHPPMESSINAWISLIGIRIHRSTDTNDSMESWRTYSRLVEPRGCDVFMMKRDEKHHFCHGFTTCLPHKGHLSSIFSIPTANATFHSKVSLIRQRYQKAPRNVIPINSGTLT